MDANLNLVTTMKRIKQKDVLKEHKHELDVTRKKILTSKESATVIKPRDVNKNVGSLLEGVNHSCKSFNWGDHKPLQKWRGGGVTGRYKTNSHCTGCPHQRGEKQIQNTTNVSLCCPFFLE